MLENFLSSYLASVATGITLVLLGFGVYKVYNGISQSTSIKQKSKMGDNTNINITINTTKESAYKLTKKLLEEYEH